MYNRQLDVLDFLRITYSQLSQSVPKAAGCVRQIMLLQQANDELSDQEIKRAIPVYVTLKQCRRSLIFGETQVS